MTYFETVELVKSKINNKPEIEGHFAAQINIEGEGEGIFYVEVKEDQVFVEPYDYVDRDVLVVTTAKEFISFIEGEEVTLKAEGADEKVALLAKFAVKKEVEEAAVAAEPVVEETVAEAETVAEEAAAEAKPVVEEAAKEEPAAAKEKPAKKAAKKSTKGKKARKAGKKKK